MHRPGRRSGRSPWLVVLILVAGSLALAGPAPALAADVVPSATVATERLGGADRYATSVAISKRLFPAGGAAVVYLASGATFPDGLAAGPIAARNGGVVLLTAAAALPAAVEAELIRLAAPRIVVLGGPSVISNTVLNRVRAVQPAAVQRLYGADRYETAALLSAGEFAAGEASTVFVASGLAFPDALAAGATAGVLGVPVLLTRPDQLPAATAAELRRLAPTKVVIVGGTGAVSSAVATAIKAVVPTVQRAAGADRYATAVAVADSYLPTATATVMATGLAFPDALSAVPLAASLHAPILLVQPEAVPVATRDALRARKPTTMVAVGGRGAISPITFGELVGWADGRLSVQPPGPTYPGYDAAYHDPGRAGHLHPLRGDRLP